MGNLANIDAVILAGGKGTRLQSVVSDRPKVLAEVRGTPFIFYQLDYLAAVGVRRVILCTGYLGVLVREVVGDSYSEMKIVYSQEDRPLDTAGALRLALPLISSDPALIMNGDSLFTSNYDEFYQRHTDAGAEGSLLLVEIKDCGRYGRVSTDSTGRITRFEEKSDQPGPGRISAGVYILAKSLIEDIPSNRPVSIEREMFPSWVGRNIYGFLGEGEFIDIGTPESYALANSIGGDVFERVRRRGNK
ncbi:MAG: nucleotidyltransferase family protein [Armatimonadetes bacterium]|nr:nucleotidyltransferase family protein [Armatimonadota bacterium]